MRLLRVIGETITVVGSQGAGGRRKIYRVSLLDQSRTTIGKFRTRLPLRSTFTLVVLFCALMVGSVVADNRLGLLHDALRSEHMFSRLVHTRDDIEWLSNGRVALLTQEGIYELKSSSNPPQFYPFRERYQPGIQFVRIDSDLYVVGMKDQDSLWGFSNDIHLLKYGESSPSKVWRCDSCSSPQIADLFDQDSPLLVFASTSIGNQELRVVDLRTNEIWRVNAAGYNLNLETVNVGTHNNARQDVCIHLSRDRRHYPGSSTSESVRLSEIDLDRKRSHIKDFI